LIEGTKAEPLFLQLMMQSLNTDGRCAVIVPDGVLFNDAKLHKLTRKYLCNNVRLAKVISLEDGLFLNTGVKSSILYFINDGKTTEIEFCKIKILEGDINEELIIKVDIKDIEKNDYSLFVNKYNVVEEEKIGGIEYKRLGDICDFLLKSKRQASYGQEHGKYPFYTSSKDLTKYCDEIDYKDESLIIGTGGNANIKINKNFSCSTDNFIVKSKNNQILNYYLYYWFINNMIKLEECFHGSTIKHISKGDLENIKIPIPSLSVQQQIVESLDLYYNTIEYNNKLIDNYEKIKKGIIWMNTINVDKQKIEDIATIKGGKRLDTTEKYSDEITDFYYIQVTEFENINDENYKNINENIYKRLINYKLESNSILISIAGTIGRIALYKSNKKSILTENAVKLVNVKINNYYLFNILKSQEIQNKFQNSYKQATIPKLSLDTIRNTNIPIPSKEIQEYIVQKCDYYDNLINTLKQENEKLQNNNIIDVILKSITNDELIDNITSDEINETNEQNEINTVSSSDIDSDNTPSPKPEKKVKKSKKTKSNEI